MQATTNMHYQMTQTVIRAKILFFDSNPTGRIISRFSKDLGILDYYIPSISILTTHGLLRTGTVVITVIFVNPWLVIPSIFSFVYMISVSKKGLKPMIEAQRLDLLYYSPINQTFTMMINGLVTFRSYRRFDFYRK